MTRKNPLMLDVLYIIQHLTDANSYYSLLLFFALILYSFTIHIRLNRLLLKRVNIEAFVLLTVLSKIKVEVNWVFVDWNK
jgi:hypothetical protein